MAPPLGAPPYRIELRTVGDPIGHEVVRVLRRDLLLSGMFVPSRGSGGQGDLRLPGQHSTVPLSSRVVVRVAQGAADLAVEGTLYFALRGLDRPAGTIRVRAPDARTAAHRLGNELYRVHTDEPGPFLSRIAFVAPRAGEPASRHIFVMDFDGAAPLRISSAGRHNILPGWSPRGDLVFTSFARGNPDLYLVRAGSRRMHPLSSRPGLNTGAAFSPDGSSIALTLTERGNQDIYVIGLDGSIMRRLTYHPKIDVSPTWAPDGQAVAFVSQRVGVPQVYVLPLAGGPPRRLTHGGRDNQEPDWCQSRGSAEIAYTSRRRGTYQIFVANAETGQTRQLTSGPTDKQSPAWSPDCRLLAYASDRGGLWTVSADGTQSRQLFRGTAITPAWSR